MNVLFITLDQFRGDSYGAAGHPLVRTPDARPHRARGGSPRRHYSQAAPCSPGRAAIYTGTYQMNNRVVANGTPLPRGLDNIAHVARRAGYDPTLFGYTDQGVDPGDAEGIDDPRLDSYDGVLPGLSVGLYLPESQAGWIQHLRAKGYDVPYGWEVAARGEPDRPAELSLSGFLTTRFLEWLGTRESGWFAHLSYLRPHPPYAAAGEFSRMYDPADVEMPIAPVPSEQRHAIHDAATGIEASAAPTDPDQMRALKAQYYGMISEVDSQLGRVVAALEERGEWEDTLVVITADHGEQLGDHGLKEKLGFFPQSYHIIGLWRDPHSGNAGRVVTRFTENVDLLPTLADVLSLDGAGPVRRPIIDAFDGRGGRGVAQAPPTTSGTTASISSDTPPTPGRRTEACRSRISAPRSATTSGTCSSPTGRSNASTSSPTRRGARSVATPNESCVGLRNNWCGDKNTCAVT